MVSVMDLVNDVGEHERLELVILVAVGVRAIDNQIGRKTGFSQRFLGNANADRIVIRTVVTAAQYQMGIMIAPRAHDRRMTFAVDAQKTVLA